MKEIPKNDVHPTPDPVVVKARNRSHKIHGGAWKVAYADFVTAMMALFIVLWVLNQNPKVVKAVGSYFKDPGGREIHSTADLPEGAPQAISHAQPTEIQWQDTEKERFESMAENLAQELSQSPEFEGFMKQIKIEIVQEGLRIEIVESADDAFFEIGTARIKPSMDRLLGTIASRLKQLPNKVIVEGHTDSRPYAGSSLNYTNFELSADRANSARRALNAGGLQDNQIEEIRGYADSHLKDREDPLNAINRRISIIVKYSSAQ
jgi:chemotaxis protein MotB